MLLLKYLPEVAGALIFMMMSTQMPAFGTVLILGQFALVGLLFLFNPMSFAETALRWWPLLLAPFLALLSALWSDLPMVSARYGAQFLFTAFIGVLLARIMTPKRFVCMFFVAMFIFCVLCIVNGRQGYAAEGMVLIGLTGSKNQLGIAAQFLMLSALSVLMMRQMATGMRWAAVLSLPVAVYLIAGTDSATALLMAIGGSTVLIGLWLSERLPPGGRLAALVAGLIVIAPLTALIPEAIAWVNHFVFDTLNKDPTLTGRTFLWARADDLIARQPLLGYGYQAIWMGESYDSIGLMRLTGMNDGRQFHFHHQFRQTAVDTGFVGLFALVGALIAVGLAAVRQFLLRPDVATSFFLVVFAVMVARCFTDTVLTPFSMHTVLFFSACTYAFWKPENAAQAAHPLGWPRLGLARA